MVPRDQTMTLTSRRLALAAAAAGGEGEAARAHLPPSNDGSSGGGGREQCWECQRRRVVCDSARPVCAKCRATGVVCPGYEDKKPLTWLAPGKVKTRTWKRKKPAAEKKEEKKNTSPSDASEEAADVLPPVMALGRAGNQIVHIFPGHELRTETCDIIEATLYWNESVFPSFAATQLTSSPWVVPAQHVHYMPAATRHALVSIAIEHRLHRLARRRTGPDPYAVEVRSRFHQHRCTAIRALNEDVADERVRGTDGTMASVMVFLFADLMGSSTASNWRHHMNGFKSLVEMRGGFEAVYRDTPYMAPMLLFPKIIETFANSTSPADDQLGPLESYDCLDTIAELFEKGYYPCLPCAVGLFTDIIRVNRLRHLMATDAAAALAEDEEEGEEGGTGTPQSLAESILESIVGFSPEAWAETRTESRGEFLLMARTYQSAAAVYAISSLQGAGALPPSSAGWRAVRAIHRGRLSSSLEAASGNPLTRNCVLWPLVVAGFEAAAAGAPAAARASVVDRLVGISRDLGTGTPRAAVEILERFWASGKETWDECFDSPHALVV